MESNSSVYSRIPAIARPVKAGITVFGSVVSSSVRWVHYITELLNVLIFFELG